MKAAMRMLPADGKRKARLNPHLWKRFKRAAEAYAETTEREVRVGWEWYYNGATRVGQSPDLGAEKP